MTNDICSHCNGEAVLLCTDCMEPPDRCACGDAQAVGQLAAVER